MKGAGPARQGGSGWGSDGSYEASVVQQGPDGAVEVRTMSHPHRIPSVAFMVTGWVHAMVHPGSELTFPLELRADRWDAPVVFDAVAFPFVFIGNETAWIGQGDVAGRGVEIRGRGRTQGLELDTVTWRKVGEE